MANVSNLQSSFHGGEWSPFSQGRMDRPDYRAGMSTCLNTLPLEEGAATRRPGQRRIGYTRKGRLAALREFHFSQFDPYALELTAGHLRLVSRLGIVNSNDTQSVALLTATNPAVIQTAADHGWATGDAVQFTAAGEGAASVGHLLDRQLEITVTDTDTFTLADPVSGAAIDGTAMSLPSGGLRVAKVFDQVTPYLESEVADVRSAQDDVTLTLFHALHQPYKLVNVTAPSACLDGEFDWSAVSFYDGPYLDTYKSADTGITVTPSALSGTITLTLSGASIPFVATDVGRLVRLFSEPAEWDAGTAYVAGDAVSYFGTYFNATAATTGDVPVLTANKWAVNPLAARWVWGSIATFVDAQNVTFTIAGNPLLYTTPIREFRMGLYSDSTGWPTGGVYHEGRFWIWGNVISNRIDGSVSNNPTLFSPTSEDGTVQDNNAVAAVFQATETNPIYWGVSDDQGLLCGTKAGEFLIRPGSGDDPITPTSIRAKRVSKYGSSNVEPARVGNALLYVNRFNRKIWEYMADASSTSPRYSASNLTLKAKHLVASGISQIVYQQELLPVVWVRTALGDLIGCTYKKDGEYAGLPEDIQAWHNHDHGEGRTYVSIQAGPTAEGLDTLYAVTKDPAAAVYQLEQLTLIFGQNAQPTTAFFVDSGVVPPAAEIFSVGPLEYVRLYGFDHAEGKTVDVWAAGYDMGQFVVTGGVVEVPLGGTGNPLTRTVLAAMTAEGSTWFGLALTIPDTASPTPGAIDVSGILQMRGANPAIVVTGMSATDVQIDWGNNLFYVLSAGNTSANGYRKINALTGDQIAEIGRDAFQGSGFMVGPITMEPNGAFIYSTTGTSNQTVMKRLDTATMTNTGSFGITAGGSFSDATHWAYPLYGTASLRAGSPFVVSADGNFPCQFTIINGDTMTWVLNFVSAKNRAALSVGAQTDTGCWAYGEVYAVSWSFTGAFPSADPAIFYRISVTQDETGAYSYGFQAIGSIVPTDINPAWTTFSNIYGCAYDPDDGGLIFQVEETGGGNTVLAKVSSEDASVIWTSAKAFNPSNQRPANGRLEYFDGSQLWLIDTTDGSFSSVATVTGITFGGVMPWRYDGNSERLFVFGDYTQAVGTPVPLGSSASSWTGHWGLLNDGTPGGLGVSNYSAPFAVGFTYTSRGQVLRPIFDAGAANGPALGKTRRVHQYSVLLQRTGPIKVGTDFSTLRPITFNSPGGTPYATGVLYNGIIQDTIESDYNFNGQVAWEITRPNPATVLAVETFLATQDR